MEVTLNSKNFGKWADSICTGRDFIDMPYILGNTYADDSVTLYDPEKDGGGMAGTAVTFYDGEARFDDWPVEPADLFLWGIPLLGYIGDPDKAAVSFCSDGRQMWAMDVAHGGYIVHVADSGRMDCHEIGVIREYQRAMRRVKAFVITNSTRAVRPDAERFLDKLMAKFPTLFDGKNEEEVNGANLVMELADLAARTMQSIVPLRADSPLKPIQLSGKTQP